MPLSLRLFRRAVRGAAVLGVLSAPAAYGQAPLPGPAVVPVSGKNCPPPVWVPPSCPVPVCPPGAPPAPGAAPVAPGAPATPPSATTTPPGTTPPATPPGGEPSTTPGADLGFAGGEGAPAGTGSSGISAPNVVGDLLLANRSVTFGFIRASGMVNIQGVGSTSITNPSVAEDNSPDPRDRVSFRYNYFHDALSVTGFGNPMPNPATGVSTAFPATKFYAVNDYTFSLEKTFFDGGASLEIRAPFATTLSSHLDLSAGRITGTSEATDLGTRPVPIFNVATTPLNTLGSEATQFGNMTLILKAKAYQSCSLLLSGGFATGIPSAPGESVKVTDFGAPAALLSGDTVQRIREFTVSNDIWSIDPFIAVLATPTDRWFAQGFLQFDFPLNKSNFGFSDAGFLAPNRKSIAIANPNPNGSLTTPTLFTNQMNTPFTVTGKIADQTLMHLNFDTGYWLVRDPDARWIRGIAPSLEVHYTSTLDNADVVSLPGNFATVLNPVNPNLPQVQEPHPLIGNTHNRLDIVDMTVGTTFLVGDRMTAAVGFSFPLSDKNNRVYDWEAQFQLNYYFGKGGFRGAPNVLGGGS